MSGTKYDFNVNGDAKSTAVLRPVPLPTRPLNEIESRHDIEQADNDENFRVEQSHKEQLIARGKMLNETYLFQEMGYRGGFEN